ncbi:MAG TPA: glycoside hydrolase family 3 N-terminal domain-containing protein, partial [Candidatus Bathyarchaeia archaeon]|nr:glycoside hydrolase family 3 N-terminal domain-containing protein [Candidatus Bathyarchaeia archaeon]
IIWLGASTPEDQKKRTRHYQTLSTNVPLLIGQDLEPGRIFQSRFPTMVDTTFNTSAQSLALEKGTKLTSIAAETIASFCKDMHVHLNFAPVADINTNPQNPVINDRAFGSDPSNVALHANAFMRGFEQQNILSCAKHFPGHGDTHQDSHYQLPCITHGKERLYDVELFPFKTLINNGVSCVMIGHLNIPALAPNNLPATISSAIITDLLKKTLNFKGLVITDALHMEGITGYGSPQDISIKALQAGVDILLAPLDIPATIAAIKKACENGILSHDLINEKVKKILQAKHWAIYASKLQ